MYGARSAAWESGAILRDRPEAERRALVDDLVDAALIDGTLTANETAAVERIATAPGLD